MTAPRVAIFIDLADWHVRELRRAFARQGAEPHATRLSAWGFDTARPHGIDAAGKALPDGAFIRAINHGTFEAVTKRLGILHAMAALGLPVWNPARVIERCVDKSMTTLLLGKAGIPVPPSWTVESREAAEAICREQPGPLVLKPLFGSQGRGLLLIERPEDLPAPEAVADVYHLQRFVRVAGNGYHDHRILVVEGEPVAAMTRRGAGWITNVRQGGKPEPFAPSPEIQALAVRSAAAVGAEFAGVDMLIDRGGAPFVLEVNSMPGWRGLQSVTTLAIADHLASTFLRRLR